jgi:MFS transporter, SP family, solute carrier family 2 (facilitated glucose transporter), member 1
MVAVMLQLAQQLSGINAVVNYSSSFFEPLFPENPEAAYYVTVGMNGGMLLASVVAAAVIDRGGRRLLLLLGTACMALSLGVLVATSVLQVAVAAAVCSVVFVTAFGFSVGPVPWLIFAELFEPSAVGAASSVCVPVNWSANIVVSVTFPALNSVLNEYVFLPFAVCNFCFFFFTWWVVPETRGRTPAELAATVAQRLDRPRP